MKRLTFALVVCLLTLGGNAWAMQKWQNWCENGGVKVSMPSLGVSTSKFMQSFPSCTVTVYDTGTSNLSTIYSDNGVTPKANPFVSDSSTGYAFFYAADGVYDVKFSGGGIASPFTLSGFTLFDSASPGSLGSLHFASSGVGSDWCAQAMSVDNSFSGQPLFLIIDNLVQSTAACSVAPTPAANHTWWFNESTTFALGSQSLTPAGANTRIYGQGYGTILTGTSGYLYDNDTHTGNYLGDLQLQPSAAASGGIRIQHRTNTSNANNWVWHVLISGTWTSGQVGALLYTSGNSDANYRNVLYIQTLNMDVGAKFQSANTITNGSNATTLYISCNGHRFCVDDPNGTDEELHIDALGAHGLTGGTGVRFGGASGGNAYGATNNVAYFGSEEQGSASVTVDYESGAQLNTTYGASSDASNVVDNSAVTTNRSNFGGVLYNPIIASNSIAFGGVASAASAALYRNGTGLEAKLGDGSAYTTFGSSDYRISVNGSLVDALSATNLSLGNSSNVRQGGIWCGVVSNLQTCDYMTNVSTTDGTTYTVINSSYGSMVRECQGSTSDANSNCTTYYRLAGTGSGKGSSINAISGAGLLSVAAGIVPSTAGTGTVGSGTLPFSSIYLGGATNHYVQLTASSSTGFTATLPNNSGTLAELNLAQSWTATQTTNSQIISTLATGTAPLVIASTTPVANLTTVPLAYNHSGTQQTAYHLVQDTCTLGTDCGVTLAGSAVYTSSSSYTCTCQDETAIGACKVAQSSGSAFTITGTGTDVIRYQCGGN